MFWRGDRYPSAGSEGVAGLVGDLVRGYGEYTMGRRRIVILTSRPALNHSFPHQSQHEASTIPEGGHDGVL